jgi:hypothetical protein
VKRPSLRLLSWLLATAGGLTACGQGSDGARPTLSSTSPAKALGQTPPSRPPPPPPPNSTPAAATSAGTPIGACVDEQGGKPYVCDEFYGDASAAIEKLKAGCNAISQHWLAACPGGERVGACKRGMKPYADFELQWSYKGKPPNDSSEAVKKVCLTTQKGTFVEAL